MFPGTSITNYKFLIGRRWGHPAVQGLVNTLPYEVVKGKGEVTIRIKHNDIIRDYSPEDVFSAIISRLKGIAEARLQEKVTDAVITVPTKWNDNQRQAVKDSATKAGLSVRRLVNEPTAAVIGYGIEKSGEPERNVVVVDIGGTTLEVTLVGVDEGVLEIFADESVKIGGEKFNDRIISQYVFTRISFATSHATLPKGYSHGRLTDPIGLRLTVYFAISKKRTRPSR